MQTESEILVLVMLGIIAMLLMASGIIVFVFLYYQKTIKNKLEIEKIKSLQSQELAINIVKAQEYERKRIASQLHDDIGASLSAIGLLLGRIKNSDNDETKNITEEAIKQNNEIMQQIRCIVQNLSPSIVERFGLTEAIADICHRISSAKKINAIFNIKFNDSDIKEKEIQVMIYRIVQELTNNAIKHADPSSIHISIISSPDKSIYIEISDDGIGIDLEKAFKSKSLGLNNIKNRVEIVGGDFSIENNTPKGTKAKIKIPLKQEIIK